MIFEPIKLWFLIEKKIKKWKNFFLQNPSLFWLVEIGKNFPIYWCSFMEIVVEKWSSHNSQDVLLQTKENWKRPIRTTDGREKWFCREKSRRLKKPASRPMTLKLLFWRVQVVCKSCCSCSKGQSSECRKECRRWKGGRSRREVKAVVEVKGSPGKSHRSLAESCRSQKTPREEMRQKRRKSRKAHEKWRKEKNFEC